jgi:hypothetical protein
MSSGGSSGGDDDDDDDYDDHSGPSYDSSSSSDDSYRSTLRGVLWKENFNDGGYVYVATDDDIHEALEVAARAPNVAACRLLWPHLSRRAQQKYLWTHPFFRFFTFHFM